MADLAPRIVLTTLPQSQDEVAFARSLLEEGLCACVNVVAGVRSLYHWQGKLEDESEKLLLIKTTSARLEELQARLHEIHPYDVPEFVVLNIEEISAKYLEWLIAETSPGR